MLKRRMWCGVLCLCGLLCDVVQFHGCHRCAVSCVSVGVDVVAMVVVVYDGFKKHHL